VWEFDDYTKVWQLWNRVGNIAISIVRMEAVWYKVNEDLKIKAEPDYWIWEGTKDSVLARVSDVASTAFSAEEIKQEISIETGLPIQYIPTLNVSTVV